MKQLQQSLFIFITLMLLSSSAFATNLAVQISIGGIGPGVDQVAASTIKQVIGMAVANGIVDKFIVNNEFIPIEGGFTACAEASPSAKKRFSGFVKQLNTIRPNRKTTAYSVLSVPSCNDVPITTVCSQEAKICPDGSYVSKIGPACNFAPCPGDK